MFVDKKYKRPFIQFSFSFPVDWTVDKSEVEPSLDTNHYSICLQKIAYMEEARKKKTAGIETRLNPSFFQCLCVYKIYIHKLTTNMLEL